MKRFELKEQEFKLFQNLMFESSGMIISDDQLFAVESKLSKLMEALNVNSYSHLYLMIKQDKKYISEIISSLTINETFWFRDEHIWEMIAEKVLPKIIDAKLKSPKDRIRIWSAAASTGQEAYSLAILVDELFNKKHLGYKIEENLEIVGTDISEAVISSARMGKYSSALISRGLSKSRMMHYFERCDKTDEYSVKKRIKDAVVFRNLNLLSDTTITLGKFDIVLCRNVAIYFDNENKKKLYRNIKSAMSDGAILVLGSSEAILAGGELFEKVSIGNFIYYRVKQ